MKRKISKSCGCGNNEWQSINSYRLPSLGHEEVLWCKNCGTIKLISRFNAQPVETTVDYRIPKNFVNK